ncbi:MAG: PDZ domain-containing protein [Vicinamibacteria bacterium]|nr:PDZ domain-containing protein [Vicinamibacteria bacterium]
MRNNSLRSISLSLAGAALALIATSPAAAQTRLLRFPAIHGDKVAFTYAGDVWTAPATGGAAVRLTAHPGMEVFAHFSPDGKWIAFTGQYDGDEQVYVMPATGGEPKQLTYYPARGPLTPRWGWDNQVYGFSPDGKSVIFRSHRESWTLGKTRLYSVPVSGGPAEALPMPESGAGEYSPDGTKLVYSPLYRDFRPEKRYSGGFANDLFIFDLKTNEGKRVIDSVRSDRDPMWIGNTIYFNSDRDGTFNLYAYDVPTAKITQVTSSKVWDVRWPGSDRASRIIYELNGELNVLDVKTGKSAALNIEVPDDGLWKRPSRVSAAGQIEDAELSPKGERALFSARGDIFTTPIEKGFTRNLTGTSGAHDKWARWSPDGSKVAFISDQSGEEELYVVAQDGSSKPERLTSGGKAMRYAPEWSADGKRIAFSDKDGRIWIYSFDDKTLKQVYDAPRDQVRDYTWSPRGHHLAFSSANPNTFRSIFIWSEAGSPAGQLHQVTEEQFNAQEPVWDPDGNFLYYLSDRQYAPQISGVEFNYASNRTTGLFAMALRKDVKHPFPPESDEVTVVKAENPEKPTDASAKPEASAAPAKAGAQPGSAAASPAPRPADDLVIDFDGIMKRVAKVPVEADNYSGLTAKKGHLIYTAGSAFFYGRDGDRKTSLRIYSLKDRKETTLVDDIAGYALSGDGSKVLVRTGGSWNLYDASPSGASSKKAVSTAGLMVDRVPEQEWNQIFNEVWRRYRDWFYVDNMHGFDWEALRKQYAAWLPFVAHRSDLNYVISEMISELTIQHAYVEGGDFQIPPRPRVALPGALFALDKASGKFRIAKIFEGQNEEDIYRSPLTEIGVSANVGDYVLAIDGVELKADQDPYMHLRGKADRPITLTLNSKPAMDGSRTVTYSPITSESDLNYLDWINRNRRKVSELSGGRVGYLHIPDMGGPGIREFIKWYYGQIRKDGLVVDVRANGGGNVSRMIIERLRRKLLAVNFGRTDELADPYPDGVFIGPMAAILDERSSSDGDIFPAMFREAGLGPLIGRRSWGGVVGISGRGPLIDGGSISVPESGMANTKGEWIIEGHGVDPDIEVTNDVKATIDGKDQQLERAVAEVMKRIEAGGAKYPKKPAGPVKVERKD